MIYEGDYTVSHSSLVERNDVVICIHVLLLCVPHSLLLVLVICSIVLRFMNDLLSVQSIYQTIRYFPRNVHRLQQSLKTLWTKRKRKPTLQQNKKATTPPYFVSSLQKR